MESTTQRQMLVDSASKGEMVDVDKLNWSPHTVLLLLGSVSTLSKAKIGLPDWCKNLMPGKQNTLYKKKLI